MCLTCVKVEQILYQHFERKWQGCINHVSIRFISAMNSDNIFPSCGVSKSPRNMEKKKSSLDKLMVCFLFNNVYLLNCAQSIRLIAIFRFPIALSHVQYTRCTHLVVDLVNCVIALVETVILIKLTSNL